MNIRHCVSNAAVINIHMCRLTADEYASLCSNLVDIVSAHNDLLSSLEDTFR